jgi:hypothetical protein
VAVGAGETAGVVVAVALADDLAVAVLGVEGQIPLVRRGRTGARVEARVAVADRLAVLHDAVVLDEGEHAVRTRVERLELVEQVAVGLRHVDVVLARVAHGDIAQHEAIGPVDEDADVFLVSDRGRAAVASSGVTRLDNHVVCAHAGAFELKVAPDARTRVRDAVTVLPRCRHRRGVGPATDDGHQVGVVRAVELVVMAQRAGVAALRRDLVLVTGRIERRLRPGGRLLVKPRHHHHAVVVACRRHCGLDLVVLAAIEQRLVDLQQLAGLGLGEGPMVGRTNEVAVGPCAVDRVVQPVHRVVLADHQRLPGRRAFQGRLE